MLDHIQKAADYIQSKTDLKFNTAIVLGSGLGNFGEEIDIQVELDYEAIPHFPISTVEGH